MTERIKDVWERVRSSVLFIPGVLVLLGIFFAMLLVEADRRIGAEPIRGIPWLFGAGASGARDVLSTIAGAMAQLAGITFSVTIVALALRSQQFGPRLLRNFTRDKANQVVLGTFVGTFVYALLVLRAVRGLEDNTFVPLLAVTNAYRMGRHRSISKDPEFGVRQIVDVAVKALSPSMNDPTTAVTCLEFLGALLIDLATRSIPGRLRYDAEGHLRVIALGTSFSGMVRLAFDQIQEHGREDVAVTVALLETLIRVGRSVRAPARLQALEVQVWKVARGADENIFDPTDRERINRLLQLAMERVGGGERGAAHYLLPLQKAG